MTEVAGLSVAEDEVAELYAALAGRLRQIVGCRVQASDPVIEDACQFAWSRLIHHRGRVQRETALGWLVTTAVREVFKLTRNGCRELSLDELAEHPRAPVVPSVSELAEQRARLDTIRALPERQQRLVWLQGLGLSYDEMAGYTGATPRTVERQLLRAKRALREAA
ncbi:MAG TPA: sigma-70 family RNA polymerase sigma factor [Solirubrobacteraceae bacterium]|jgi:RNA polymerase sigma factor (sigma-70 family)